MNAGVYVLNSLDEWTETTPLRRSEQKSALCQSCVHYLLIAVIVSMSIQSSSFIVIDGIRSYEHTRMKRQFHYMNVSLTANLSLFSSREIDCLCTN